MPQTNTPKTYRANFTSMINASTAICAVKPRLPISSGTMTGSDSSAGTGIQADLKSFSALGVYGLTAVTCVVAEIPGKVSRIEQVSLLIVRKQIDVLVKNFEIGAIKTGLLCSAEIVSAV